MDSIIKIFSPILLILGLVFLIFESTASIGIIILLLVLPLTFLYFVTFWKRITIESKIDIKFKIPFLILLSTTLVPLPFVAIFRILHWPFINLLTMVVNIAAVLTLLFGIIYIFSNRNNLSYRVFYEFIILTVPVAILWFNLLNVNSIKKDEYSKVLHSNYNSLNYIQSNILKRVTNINPKTDSLINVINIEKKDLITYSGGYDEVGTIKGWNDKSRPEVLLKHSGKIEKLLNTKLISDINKNKLENAKTVIEHLIVLTEIQNELLINEINM